jgi:hypothetical protein
LIGLKNDCSDDLKKDTQIKEKTIFSAEIKKDEKNFGLFLI